jgi:hypothetical protein
MTSSASDPNERSTPALDPHDAAALIDTEAAEIDARAPDAPERIAELAENADELGLPTPEPSEVDTSLPHTAEDPNDGASTQRGPGGVSGRGDRG